jgi:hypothetical protein
MAIDSALKRKSVSGVPGVPLSPGVTPDAAKPAAWRASAAWLYAGISIAAPLGDIDTAAKRRSAGGVPFLPIGPGVTPDSGKDAFWRASSAWSYGGIPAGEPPEEPEPEVVARTRGGYLPPRRKPRTPDWKRKRDEEQAFVEYLEGLYASIKGEAPVEVAQAVQAYTEGRKPKTQPPAAKRVDFHALSRNLAAVERLLDIAEQAREDEDIAVLFLL